MYEFWLSQSSVLLMQLSKVELNCLHLSCLQDYLNVAENSMI